MNRRLVRVSSGCFDTIDAQLRADRGPHGAPSATDFIAHDLPLVIERFATGFDRLPEWVDGVPGSRLLIARGYLVRAVAGYGVLADDGAVDLVGISIEL